MKKIVAILALVLALILVFTGCVSEEERQAAQEVSTMIEELGTITIDSEKAILSAQEAYDALTDNAKPLVENYDVLEAAQDEFVNVFKTTMDDTTEKINQIDAALTSYDMVTVDKLVEETLPVARSLEACSLFDHSIEAVSVLEGIQDTVKESCYPNTHIIKLDNYISLAQVSNATAASTNDGERHNTDSDTGMGYITYQYNNATQMSNAFLAYKEYLSTYFEVTDISTSSSSARYMFADEEGRAFYVQWSYYNLGYYAISSIYVGFAPEMGVFD